MRFCSASFTGKERDEETGYGYFGARYMDHELMTMWLSVDPMADKYPSVSPYAYCAWNPVRLVDPDGRKIDSASLTEEIRNLISPTHECYNADFASVFQILDNDQSTIYRFEEWKEFHTNSNGYQIAGSVSLSKDQVVIIGFTFGVETELVNSEIAPERALFEETYHAKQFCDGKIGFTKYQGVSYWSPFALDVADEDEAHEWANHVSGTNLRYDLSYYNLGMNSITAEEAWRNHSPETRNNLSPKYDSNGLHLSSAYCFKRPKL